MNRRLKWSLGVSIALMLGLTGCAMEEQAPAYKEINRMSSLDGELQRSSEPQSPVLLDAYDRSIPEEVYSTD